MTLRFLRRLRDLAGLGRRHVGAPHIVNGILGKTFRKPSPSPTCTPLCQPCLVRAAPVRHSLEFFRPLPRSVKHPQDFHRLTAHTVGHDVRCSLNHQLSRPRNSSRPAHGWILLQKIHGPQNPQHYPPRRHWVIHRNVLRLRVQVGQRSPQPSNAHGEPTSSPRASLRSHLQSLLGPPPPALCESLQSASCSAPRSPGSLPPPGTIVTVASPPLVYPAFPSALRQAVR